MVIAGLPPLGCLPIQMTMRFVKLKGRVCVEDENLDAQLYNQKLEKRLSVKQAELPQSKIVFADAYEPLFDMINHPEKYGKPILFPVHLHASQNPQAYVALFKLSGNCKLMNWRWPLYILYGTEQDS